MKHIIKIFSPSLFESWKQQSQFTAENIKQLVQTQNQEEIWEKLYGQVKKAVKDSLLQEQWFICCYCQQKIIYDNMNIEHFIARNTEPEKMFDYDNIFACCDGGQKERTDAKKQGIKKTQRTPEYCDRKKADDLIKVSPLNDNCESHFYYSFNFDFDKPEVQIEALSSEGQDAIEKLNLDTPKLRSLRGAAVVELIYNENDEVISDQEIAIRISIVKQRNEKKEFRPFCVVLESVLQSLLPGRDYDS